MNNSSSNASVSPAPLAEEYTRPLDNTGKSYFREDYKLDLGEVLPTVEIRYNTYGELNDNRDNVLFVCHALTANSQLDAWWGSMLADSTNPQYSSQDRDTLPVFDSSKYFIVCANILGSCYGSTGPTSINPRTGKRYGTNFPKVTLRDSVRLHIELLQKELGVRKVKSVIGGSMGGMQALEWAILGKDFVESAVVIGCGYKHSAWQIAINEIQRQAIFADSKWNNGDFDLRDPPRQGLAAARQMAMLTYRTEQSYNLKFDREVDPLTGRFQVQNYLYYQGRKFLDRFDALTYVTITEIMDRFDLKESDLAAIDVPVLVLAMTHDLLYPVTTQQELVNHLKKGQFGLIDTINGHDGFLLENDQVARLMNRFIRSVT